MTTKTRFTLEEKIDAFALMANLVEMVGPGEDADEEQVRYYEIAEALAATLHREAVIERETRDLVAKWVEEEPRWKDDLTALKKIARDRVRDFYGE